MYFWEEDVLSNCGEILGSFFPLNMWENNDKMRALVEAESHPAVTPSPLLSLLARQEPLTFYFMLLFSLLLPLLSLQTMLFSLRFAHPLPL